MPPRTWTGSRVSRVAWTLFLAGCAGKIGSGAPDDGVDDPNLDPQAECADAATLGVPMQRINQAQFRQVVRELFGDDLVYEDTFPPPLLGFPFSTFSAANPVAGAQVKPIMEVAEAIAMQVADRVPACAGDETACATTYLEGIAGRAFRRAPAADELAILVGLYTDARASMDYAESVAVAVSGLLQMPQFLYLLEDQPSDGETEKMLDGQEIAQRMAFLYWNGLPDDELLEKASAGALADPSERRAQAMRMLLDPKASPALSTFLSEWLTIKGFKATVHAPEIQDALAEELRRNLADALAAPDGVLFLFTSSDTHVNSVLEDFYGLPRVSTGPDDWRPVTLDPAQRVGVLTHPLLMARLAHGESASDILRGKFVRMNLLCADISPPPQGAQEAQATLTPPGASIRDQAQARIDHATCGACHKLMDPIGFGFSAFDGAGRYAGAGAVDESGEILPPSDLAGKFTGVRALGERLAESAEGRACFATQWLRYTLAKEEAPGERCAMENASTELATQSLTLLDLFAGVAAAPAFAQRITTEVE